MFSQSKNKYIPSRVASVDNRTGEVMVAYDDRTGKKKVRVSEINELLRKPQA